MKNIIKTCFNQIVFKIINHYYHLFLSNLTPEYFISWLSLESFLPYLHLKTNQIKVPLTTQSELFIKNISMKIHYNYFIPQILIDSVSISINLNDLQYLIQSISNPIPISNPKANNLFPLIDSVLQKITGYWNVSINTVNIKLTIENQVFLFKINQTLIEKRNEKTQLSIFSIQSNNVLKIQNIYIETMNNQIKGHILKISSQIEWIIHVYSLLSPVIHSFNPNNPSNPSNPSNSSNPDIMFYQLNLFNINHCLRIRINHFKFPTIESIQVFLFKKLIIELLSIQISKQIEIATAKTFLFLTTGKRLKPILHQLIILNESEDLNESLLVYNEPINNLIMTSYLMRSFFKGATYFVSTNDECQPLLLIHLCLINDNYEKWSANHLQINFSNPLQIKTPLLEILEHKNKAIFKDFEFSIHSNPTKLVLANSRIDLFLENKPRLSMYERIIDIIDAIPSSGPPLKIEIINLSSLSINLTVNKKDIIYSDLIKGEIWELLSFCNFNKTHLIISEKWIYYPDTLLDGFKTIGKHLLKELKNRNYETLLSGTPVLYLTQVGDIIGDTIGRIL
jgi:hypothetical protein